MISSEDRSAFDAWLDLPSLVKGGRVVANWLPDGRFWYAEGPPEATSILAFDPRSGRVAPLFDTAKVREAYRCVFGREAPWHGLPFSSIAPAAGGGYTVTVEGQGYVLDAGGSTLTALPRAGLIDLMFPNRLGTPQTYVRRAVFPDQPPSPEMPSPDGRWLVAIREHDVWLRSAIDGHRERMTFDGEALNGWDVESVRRVMSGGQLVSITTNPWSPDSLKLFATRLDERGIRPFTRIRWGERSDDVESVILARAGERLQAAHPHIIDVLRRVAVPVDVPVEDRLLVAIGWSADGSQFSFAQFSRDVSWAGLYRVDAATGKARLLHEEKSETFVRIQHQVISGRAGITLLPDGGFLWESSADGWKHLYHHDAEGVLVRQLTSGHWPVMDVRAVDPTTGFVYFVAHHDPQRPYDVHLCRVPLAGGAVERLTVGEGMHEAQISPDRSYFIDTVSSPDSPPQSVVRNASGEVIHRFAPADVSALEAVGWCRAEQATVKAADGVTELWSVIYKPRDFDPAKSYPVLEYIYGGPQSAVAPHHFVLPLFKWGALMQALPQLGYVVVITDARGTPERSKAFHDATYKDWRRHVTADHAAALRNLAKDRPWMDLGRVGIWGHSWGGYYTFANLIDTPELYRAGVCSAPGFDPYDAFIYEPYLGGVPASHNRAAYEDAYLIHDAGKLKSQLMIAAGTNDASVWQSAIRMSDALIKADHPHEFVPLPAQYHGYAGTYERYLIEKMIDFFERHVKNAAAPKAVL